MTEDAGGAALPGNGFRLTRGASTPSVRMILRDSLPGGQPPRHVFLPVTLVMRETCEAAVTGLCALRYPLRVTPQSNQSLFLDSDSDSGAAGRRATRVISTLAPSSSLGVSVQVRAG